MALVVTINGGFAEVDAGSWLAGRGQPAAFSGALSRRRRTGWFLRDRSALDLVETTGRAWFADASRPFLTYIPCAAPLCAVSSKVLCAPASARAGAELVKTIPMGSKGAFAVTKFEVSSWDDMVRSVATAPISLSLWRLWQLMQLTKISSRGLQFIHSMTMIRLLLVIVAITPNYTLRQHTAASVVTRQYCST